jgi:hypothetical protein
MIVLYVVFLVRCVPAKWWFRKVYNQDSSSTLTTKQIIDIKRNEKKLLGFTNIAQVHLSCLEKSLSLSYIYKLRGVQIGINFGVAGINRNSIKAHAWLNYVVLDAQMQGYEIFKNYEEK